MDAHQVTKTYYCKFPNCTNEASSPVGRYSYCRDHQGKTNGSRRAATTGVADQIASLAAEARNVDRLQERARKLTQDALKAKAAADEAARAFRVKLAGIVRGEEQTPA